MAITSPEPLNHLDFISFAALSSAFFGIAPTLNKCAKNSAALTPEDRERLRNVAELQPAWVQFVLYRCPAHRVSTNDKEVISALLRQAQNAPKERPLVVSDN